MGRETWIHDQDESVKRTTVWLSTGTGDERLLRSKKMHTFFQQLIGILRWAVELGRINIACEVSILSSFLAAPRMGHIEAILHSIPISASTIDHGSSSTRILLITVNTSDPIGRTFIRMRGRQSQLMHRNHEGKRYSRLVLLMLIMRVTGCHVALVLVF